MGNVLVQDPGTRSGRRRSRARKRRALVVLTIVASFAAGAGIARVILRADPPPEPIVGDVTDGEQLTTLVAMTLASDPSQQADSLTLFGIDRTGRKPVVLFVPVGTLGVIPGQDFGSVGKALSLGRLSLQQTTVENLLGIVIDRTISIDDVSIGSVIDDLGGIDVEVEERLVEDNVSGVKEQVFPLGRRHMGGAEAVSYMTYRGEGESELERFPRTQKVWEGIFAATGNDVARLEAAFASLGPSVLGSGGAAGFAEILRAFILAGADARTYEVMPPETVGSGGPDEVFKVNEQELAAVIARAFAGSRPVPGVGVGARVEIRNGNGVPEVGERVAALLVPSGFRIAITGNARRFDFASTRIVVYGDDQQALALGERVRSLLGVGRVEIGRRAQTVVDVTVVVGRDFPERKA